MQTRTKTLAILALLSAMAYILMVFIRIPVILFLKYEPKDVVIAIGGFLFGPLAALAMSVVVSAVEMVTVSETGFIGMTMNVISSCCFACSAALVYKKMRTLKGAMIGLISGCILTTAVMLLWNYLLTPVFMGSPRADVAAMLVPFFLPFNLIKGGLNASIAMLLYKPVRIALQKSYMMPEPAGQAGSGKVNPGIIVVSLFIIATCVMLILVFQGII